MAELAISADEVIGIKKEIDSGAMDLIFSALQSDIYSFPIRSFVRETVSNGLDSVIEKNIFKAIHSGEPQEKYYLKRQDGKLLKDSQYQPEYYKVKHLGAVDKVTVTYKEGSPRDTISIRDYGVGLGSTRLKGWFTIGFSTKRNMKHIRGKFGMGSKAALATGVDYFTMTTVYNGYKTSFMVYARDYENITQEAPNGKVEIWNVTMADGSVVDRKIYWEKTLEANSVTVELEVKKHNKSKYTNAVIDQFQYFKGDVMLTTIKEDGSKDINSLDENAEYESQAILIPKYSTYSSPHILVDGISYGLISWDELELEHRKGRIAIKVTANEVDITQSRESLKWTEKTKATILEAVNKAEVEVGDHIDKMLNINNKEDIFHINDIYGKLSRSSSDSVTSAFSTFLNLSNITPAFTIEDDKLGVINAKLNQTFFDFLFYKYSFKRVTTTTYNSVTKIETFPVSGFHSLKSSLLVYAKGSSLGPKRAAHIIKHSDGNSFVYIRENKTKELTIRSYYPDGPEYKTEDVRIYADTLLRVYSNIFLDTYDIEYDDDKEEDLEKKDVSDKVDLAKIRRENKEVLYTEYESESTEAYEANLTHRFKRERTTVKIKDIEEELDIDKEDLIICTGTYRKLGKMIELMSKISDLPTLRVIYVAEDVLKYFAPYGIFITDYFRELNTETGELMIGKYIRELNTYKKIFDLRDEYLAFSNNKNILHHLVDIDSRRYFNILESTRSHSELYSSSVRSYLEENITDSSDIIKEIFDYLEVLTDFQDTVLTGKKTVISEKALELFGTDKIYHLNSYDKEFVDKVEEEFKRIEPISPVLECMYDTDNLLNTVDMLNLLLTTLKEKQEDE